MLLPTLGMLAMATVLASEALTTRDSARRVDARVATLGALADARVVLVNERTTSGVLVFATELGFDEEELLDFTGTDHRSELLASRTAVDTSAILRSLPAMADHRSRLHDVREAVDEGTASSSQVVSIYDDLTAAVDQAWTDEFDQLQDDLRSGEVTGSLQNRAGALRAAFAAQRWGMTQASLVIELYETETSDPATEIQVIAAGARYHAAVETLEDVRGPIANEVWDDYLSDPAVRRFGRDLEEVEEELVSGPSLVLEDPATFQQSLADAEVWAAGLGDLVRAAAQDLSTETVQQERDAANSLQVRVGAAGVLTLLSLAGAVLLTRNMTRPVRRLEEAASQIRAGQFDLEPIETGGPRELADTAVAFNEMTATLASVETYATTLADAPEDPLLDHPIPGRTGQALQVALNRLRSSIRQAEKRRGELEVVATHDALTGLFNRSAALTMIGHDLAAAERSDGAVMALFIDLDEFKPINDQYGHAAGDDALRLVADALRETTREADVVARIGGDEFLVAGAVADDAGEVEGLAERIRDAIGSTRLGTVDGPIGLHCSIGMALSLPGDSVDLLVQRADAAMYDAKKQGRDRIAWARSERMRPSQP
ncbi:MAG: sensor domain-containing diguanylate cyclase [Acidimicrobiales bacterium]|nr:sensor domain-containing diguanylate cyclase [Acidimicrobiales bacterium]